MFRNRELWRHKSCTEIDVYILKVQYRSEKYIKCRVLYYNRNAIQEQNKLIDYRPETVKIFRKDLKNWNPVYENLLS